MFLIILNMHYYIFITYSSYDIMYCYYIQKIYLNNTICNDNCTFFLLKLFSNFSPRKIITRCITIVAVKSIMFRFLVNVCQ